MIIFSSFVLSFGSLLALMCVIAAWLFRTSAAPLWSKIAIPMLIVGLGCYAPFAVAQMMGFPIQAMQADLPDHAEMIAFVPHDEDGYVDLWLRAGDVPRAYEIKLTASMKKMLRDAREAQERGQRAMLAKQKHGHEGMSDALGIGGDDNLYVLDPSAMSTLPAKE